MGSGERVASGLFGGLIVGVWVYGLLFGFPDWSEFEVGRWFTWGFLGLAIAGAIYGTRATDQTVRLVMVVLMGIILSIVIMGAIFNENEYVFATLATTLGGGLITTALPTPKAWTGSGGQTPTTSEPGAR